MKLSVSRETFLARLGVAVRGASTRGPVPSLAGVLLRVDDGRAELQATDMELGVRVSLETTDSTPGQAVVPGRLLLDVVRSLPKDDLTLEYRSAEQDVEVMSGPAKFHLRTLPPSARPSEEHDLWFFFGWRWVVTFWKWFFFTPGPFTNVPGLSDIANRGAYLVQALGHCSECHTPRNFLGGPKTSRFLGGGKGPDGKNVANLTPTGLKKQSDRELVDFLTTGLTAEGDVPAEAMGEVIRNTTSQLTPSDLNALIAYLRTLPPVPSEKK